MRRGSSFRDALAIVGEAASLVVGLAGCASTPQATVERDTEARQFTTHPAASTLFIYRPDAAQDESVLWVDGRLIGATLPHTFFRVHLDPGRHVITGMAADNGQIDLETRPGAVYFVSLSPFAGQSYFQQVPEEVGRKVITNCCRLMENWAPGQRPLLR